MRFKDRREAGRLLAEALRPLGLEDPGILAIPRGGVVVADEVARALGGSLDLVLVRKLGAPGNPEFALGALGEDGQVVLMPHWNLYADETYLQGEVLRQKSVLRARAARYRAKRPKRPLKGRDVVVVDDGVATGATMEAALKVVRTEEPRRLVAAAPVMSKEAARRLEALADQVVALSVPEAFGAVGAYYLDFREISDEDVEAILIEWAS
ncbi:MAG: phosphoribosyltransferase [Thermaceae bacterium]